MRRTFAFLVLAPLASLLAACKPQETPDPQVPMPYEKELLQVAADYKQWGRVDDEYRWAPELCTVFPGRSQYSESADEETHGRKMYSLLAKHRSEYYHDRGGRPQPIGQVIVKESWVPEETKEVNGDGVDHDKIIREGDEKHDGAFFPYVKKGDKVFKASKRADLFIMMKLDPKTPATDDGWIYATVSPDLKTVTASGKLESCMKCHQDAKHDRLFGLPAN